MKEHGILRYLERARALDIIPNFWLSREYLSIQDVKVKDNGKAIWIMEGEWCVFPPLPLNSRQLNDGDCPPLRIWSDFENFSVGRPLDFLDWEYTYNSCHFRTMSGKKWAVFRKNSRKWPKGKEWSYTWQSAPENAVEDLLLKWLKRKSDEDIHDEDSMLWFLTRGTMRAFLYDRDRLVGINVWDALAPYLMYRYCVTDPDEPFLNEFARLLFYQSMPGVLVIDGGSLGNAGLERFKDKLNPIKKRKVCSWVINKRKEEP